MQALFALLVTLLPTRAIEYRYVDFGLREVH